MRLSTLILLLFLLSSCFPYYKQLDSNNKPVDTHQINLQNCRVSLSLEKQYLGVAGDYHAIVSITPLIKDQQIKLSDIKVTLVAYGSGKLYKPSDVKCWNQTINEPFIFPHPNKTPSLNPAQTLTLLKGNTYALVYSLYGHHHSKLKLDVAVNINGETTERSMIFKKHTKMELFH